MYNERKAFYKDYEEMQSTRIISYITGNRPGMETQIASDAFPFFVEHLDRIGVVDKISLYLYTEGGSVAEACSIINFVRLFCENLEVIVPSKCRSAGTLMCLGADAIVMTKQATLGPIDPTCNGLLNPLVPGAPNPYTRVPVSVEAINGYINIAKEELKICDNAAMADILISLSDKIHPLTLGDTYRARKQIRMLAEKLLRLQGSKDADIPKIVDFLCCDSGSHDYSINRREAKALGLNVRIPTVEEYNIIKSIYEDFSEEMEFKSPFNQLPSQPGGYEAKRVFVETLDASAVFFTKIDCISGMPSGNPGDGPVFSSIDGWRDNS